MDITQLKYFVSLAQTLNFSEAARRRGISQPSMSHSIGELEKQLGAQLFVRSRKGVAMTDAGRELLPNALQIIDLAEKAQFNLKQLELGKSGSLSLSVLTTTSVVFSEVLSAFSKNVPISLQILFLHPDVSRSLQ